MSNIKNQNISSNDLKLNLFLESYSIKKLIFSTDTLCAIICTNIIMTLIAYISMTLQAGQQAHNFLIDISNMICSNTINIDSSLLVSSPA